MKKLMILAATTAAISSSAAFADMDMFGMEQFYIKVAAGANKLNKIKLGDAKFKSKAAPVVNLAVGYSVTENVRAELEGGYIFSPKLKYSDEDVRIQVKPKIWTLMVAGYADLPMNDMFSVFAGVGLGTAAVKDKLTVQDIDPTTGAVIDTESGSTKKKYNFSYQLTAGVSAKVAEGVTAELAYRWQEYGKSKVEKGVKAPKHKGHNLMAGVRFAI
jgi:opacity protein-like surface antigen